MTRRSALIAVAALTTILASQIDVAGQPAHTEIGVAGSDALPQPRAAMPMGNWVDDVIEVLEDIEDAASGGKQVVQSHGAGGLSDLQRLALADHLDAALLSIDRILDTNQSPSLQPGDAGSIDETVAPATLEDYASTILALAEDAFAEAVAAEDDLDDEYVGTLLKTIEHLITRTSPHSYQSLAGI